MTILLEAELNVINSIWESHLIWYSSSCQVTVIVDSSEAEEFAEVLSKPIRSLPYDTPGQTFVAFEKPEGVPAVGKFSNMLKFIVKEVQVFPLLMKMLGISTPLLLL